MLFKYGIQYGPTILDCEGRLKAVSENGPPPQKATVLATRVQFWEHGKFCRRRRATTKWPGNLEQSFFVVSKAGRYIDKYWYSVIYVLFFNFILNKKIYGILHRCINELKILNYPNSTIFENSFLKNMKVKIFKCFLMPAMI